MSTEFDFLTSLEQEEMVPQMSLSKRIAVSVGLINALVKRAMTGASTKRAVASRGGRGVGMAEGNDGEEAVGGAGGAVDNGRVFRAADGDDDEELVDGEPRVRVRMAVPPEGSGLVLTYSGQALKRPGRVSTAGVPEAWISSLASTRFSRTEASGRSRPGDGGWIRDAPDEAAATSCCLRRRGHRRLS